jgi:hypothetical protein
VTTPPDPNDPFAPPPSGSVPPPSPPEAPAWGAPAPGSPPPGYGTPPGYPPPAYGQSYGYGPPSDPSRTNTLAIVAFVTTFLCTPAGLICGFLALSQIKKSGEQGRGLALAAVILSGLFLVVSVVFFLAVLAFGTVASSEFSEISSTCVTSDGYPC